MIVERYLSSSSLLMQWLLLFLNSGAYAYLLILLFRFRESEFI
ncbi:hypothetical protein JCM19297_2172 [Nonlabens ulvanivorans]|nr:hypothetical protein JCM19297_2172 [Nonlabens ulvanivorans]